MFHFLFFPFILNFFLSFFLSLVLKKNLIKELRIPCKSLYSVSEKKMIEGHSNTNNLFCRDYELHYQASLQVL